MYSITRQLGIEDLYTICLLIFPFLYERYRNTRTKRDLSTVNVTNEDLYCHIEYLFLFGRWHRKIRSRIIDEPVFPIWSVFSRLSNRLYPALKGTLSYKVAAVYS